MTDAPGSDPLDVLVRWHAEARARGGHDPDIMALATADAHGQPSVRVVLYKGLVNGRIRFVTNYQSRKAREMEANPRVALMFHFPALARQVRIEGLAERAPESDSDAYFASRPRESQIGAWASPQSDVIESRAELERRCAEVEARFAGRAVERPPHWGAYWVDPVRVELWIGGEHRLHDRFAYERSSTGTWTITRLAP